MARPKKSQDEGNKVPTWIVSFSDMVTLLLAFFVLLQSFASVRDPELFFIGQGSFKQAIAGFGLPAWLWGNPDRPEREGKKVLHPTEEGPKDQLEERIIDAEAEKIRQMFETLKEQIATEAADMSRQTLRVEATPIAFAPGRSELDAAGRSYLRQLATDLGQSVRAESLSVYVIGLAADGAPGRERWYVSARRAAAVQGYLQELLARQGRKWTVISWGAGAGGAWCRRHGLVPQKTSIAIAVVKESVSDGR